MTARTRILLTGFGPFPGVPVNATMRLVPVLAEAASEVFPDLSVNAMLLATEWQAAPRRLLESYAAAAPDLVLHFGVSSRARGFEIECRARNACQASPDAAGALPSLPHVAEKGQDFMPATLPVRYIVQRLRQRRIPAFASWDAGAYLCNCVLYHSLVQQRTRPEARVGFVHLPASLARPGAPNRGRSGACALTWGQTLEGSLEIIAASLGRPSPRAKSLPLSQLRLR